MPLVTKVGLGVIMGLGVCATIATGFKIYLINDFFLHDDSKDPLYGITGFIIVGEIELYLAVIAASIPALRNLFTPIFSRLTSRNSKSSKSSKTQSSEGMKIPTIPSSMSTVENSEEMGDVSV